MSDEEMQDSGHDTSVAIIGMSGRFPAARNKEEFWRNLCDGVEAIAFASREQLENSGLDPSVLEDPQLVKASAIIEDMEMFDAPFFGYSPREAELMDPQQRLFLECAWEAFEDAGYNPEKLDGMAGVFAGSGINTYLMHVLSSRDADPTLDGLQLTVGNDKDYLTTRLSYKLHLRGPSVCVQTACSTSLVAVHLACQSLLGYECDVALAGGVSIRAPQPRAYRYQEGSILSPDGHCRAFDAKAGGTIFGNGLGVVVLKRLQDAIEDRDHIYAVIRGSAINNDGSLKVGYTAPSVEGQSVVIKLALAAANVDASTISSIEAHGTATSLGDAIEIEALKLVFGERPVGSCALGSVKTNVGHLDAAAGVTGLIKTALALKHGLLPPSLHFERSHPDIGLEQSPFYVNTNLKPFPSTDRPRRAGISSFGIGGTNSHAILEEAPVLESSEPQRRWQLLALSARSESALNQAALNLAAHLRAHPELKLADVAYTSQVGRKAFAHRQAFVCEDTESAIGILESVNSPLVAKGVAESEKAPVIFMFPGQGAQHADMARELYQTEPTFKAQVDACAEILRTHLGEDLRELLYPRESNSVANAEKLAQTKYTQPALFVVEYALAKLWMEWGVQPSAMIGHSIGEYVAACLAGVWSLEDALALVAMRGRLMQEQPTGAMLAVALSEPAVKELMRPGLSLAAVNGSSLCVVSGDEDSIASLHGELNERGVTSRLLRTSHAYHSKMMEAAIKPFKEYLEGVRMHAPKIAFISNVTGVWIEPEQATSPQYWAQHLRETVRFNDGLQTLSQKSNAVLLEVGPAQTLSKLARRQPADAKLKVVASLPEPDDQGSQADALGNALGKLWVAGVEIDWKAFHAREERLRVSLPPYPFERQRFWFEKKSFDENGKPARNAAQERAALEDWSYVPSWKQTVPVEALALRTDITDERAWLIFQETEGPGASVSKRLRETGQNVFSVVVGEEFERRDERTFSINPRRAQDYEQLMLTLQSEGVLPHTIAHFWSITTENAPHVERSAVSETVQETLERGFNSLMFLAQGLGNCSLSTPLHLCVVTNNLESVTGDEIIDPLKATVRGLCRVIPQEYANIECRTVDVSIPRDTTAENELAAQLIEELRRVSTDEQIAYRGARRWAQGFERLKIGGDSQDAVFRERGVYLITGGLGGLGLALAAYLAKGWKAKLILVGRSGLTPDRVEGVEEGVEESGDGGSVMERIRELEESGAEVLVTAADVTVPEQVAEVLRQARERFGEIHGVFHLAGVPGGGLIQVKSLEMTTPVLAPKVQGTLTLEELLRDAKLDFMVLFSSLTSITGGLGQVDYCAASAFLDAFAQHKATRNSTPTITIDWDAWQSDTWQDALLRTMPELHKIFKERREKFGIRFEEGFELLRRIIGAHVPQVVISTQNLASVIANHRSFSQAALMQKLGGARAQGANGNGNTLPRNEVEQRIAEIWKEVLGVQELNVHDNFIDLGGHSLLAVQLVARLREELKTDLPLRTIFEHPTVAGMAELIMGQNASEVDSGEMARLLEEIEDLSEEEVYERLSKISQNDVENRASTDA
jgi:acyl transferase domain-containing protein/acyl carrier protein